LHFINIDMGVDPAYPRNHFVANSIIALDYELGNLVRVDLPIVSEVILMEICFSPIDRVAAGIGISISRSPFN